MEPHQRCDDSVFVRRLYLDLIGHIPTREEAAEFLTAANGTRRDALIESLLATPG